MIGRRKHARQLVAPLRTHGRLAPAVADDVLVAASVGPAGEAVALWLRAADLNGPFALPVRPNAALTAWGHPLRPIAARVTTHWPSIDQVISIAEFELATCRIQPLPGGKVLLVEPRCRRGGTNAVLVDAAGEPVQAAALGDGIEHALTTPTGNVWVGYFDEGVYGRDSLSGHGIVRFGQDLQPDWRYSHHTEFGPVDDCYALNVHAETAWSYYYSSFPIVRIDPAGVSGWRTGVTGATALIADSGVCALVGGYRGAERDRLVVGDLGGGRFEQRHELRLVLPDGEPSPCDRVVLGRGPDLHVFADQSWYRLDLDEAARIMP